MRIKIYLCFLVFILSSCSSIGAKKPTNSLYIWDDYMQSSLEQSTLNTKQSKLDYLNTLEKITAKSKKMHKRVAPGINAQIGQLNYELGHKEKAIFYLKKEKELYPESSVFIDEVIKDIQTKDKL